MEEPVFRVDVATGKVTRLTGDGHAGNVDAAAPTAARSSPRTACMAPDDLFRVDAERQGHAG